MKRERIDSIGILQTFREDVYPPTLLRKLRSDVTSIDTASGIMAEVPIREGV